MCDRETVELAPCAPGEGMTRREAAELCGVSRASVGFWAAGRVPHERGAGRIRVDGRTGARDAGVPAVNTEERAACAGMPSAALSIVALVLSSNLTLW